MPYAEAKLADEAARYAKGEQVLAAGWFRPMGEMHTVGMAAVLTGTPITGQVGARAVATGMDGVPFRTLLAVTPTRLVAIRGSAELRLEGVFKSWVRQNIEIIVGTHKLTRSLVVHNRRTGKRFGFETTRPDFGGHTDVVFALLGDGGDG